MTRNTERRVELACPVLDLWARERLFHIIDCLLYTSLTCALSPSAALGGGAGWTVTSALRYGVARGVFTNEAGLGTSAMAHGAAQVDHPARQGMWGIFEVFLSTLVVCTVTALTILVSGVWEPGDPAGLTGAPLTAAAFGSALGRAGEGVVCLLYTSYCSPPAPSDHSNTRFGCPYRYLLKFFRRAPLLMSPFSALWRVSVIPL